MGRSYSYSPSPPRSYGRRYRSPSPMGYYRVPSRDPSTRLLVRNLRHDCRQEDLRRPFGRFGRLKDIYIPRNYYTGAISLGIGIDPTQGQDQGHGMNGEAEAKVPDTECDGEDGVWCYTCGVSKY